MFQVKLLNFNSVIYEGVADKVLFNILDKGQICILTHHIKKDFKIMPSICYVFSQDQKYLFYIGFGFAKFFNNTLLVTSNLFTDAISYQQEAANLGIYGQNCIEKFQKVRI